MILELLASPVFKQILLTFHVVSVVIGFGGATVTDILFFRFLKDFFISHKENEVMRTLASIIVTAMVAIIISGLLLYLGDMPKYNGNPRFLVKLIAAMIASFNGLAMHLLVSPKLLQMSFALEHDQSLNPGLIKRTRRLSRLAFAMGAISAVSWWMAFLIAMLKGLMTTVPFWPLLGGYFGVMTGAVIISQIMEMQYEKRGQATGRLSRKWTTAQGEAVNR